MNRGFYKGDTVICSESDVVGVVLSYYNPASCEEQTLVKTKDGRKYHAPTSMWVKYKTGFEPKQIVFDEVNSKPNINIQSYMDKVNQDIFNAFKIPSSYFNDKQVSMNFECFINSQK